jgi:pyridoxal phosphate enzyme (YggS family)
MLDERITEIRQRIGSACERAGREASAVRLIGVTKKVAPELVTEGFECGLGIMGENRVQEAKQKMPLCPGGIEWHMIGHLQSNKVKDTVRLFRMIHSIDSLRLLECVDSEASNAGVTMPVCLEVNVSGESSKFGVAPDDLPDVLKAGTKLMNVDIVGLMTMPPFTADPEGARPFFKELRTLRDSLRQSSGFELGELSMGMSNDFEVAIEEGSTMVRVGNGIFGGRKT